MTTARSLLSAAAVLAAGVAVFAVVGCEVGGDDAGTVIAASPVHNGEIVDPDVVPAATGPHPKLAVVGGESFYFDTLALGKVGTHVFTIRNEGEAPLKLGTPKTTCKCTIPDIANAGDGVPPGGETQITLEFTPHKVQAEFAQKAMIPTNDPETPQLDLVIRGRVDDLLAAKPSNRVAFGAFTGNEPAVETFAVMTRMLDEVDVKGVESSSENLTATVEPMPRAEAEERGYRAGVRVRVEVDPKMPVGEFKETVKLRFDQEEPYHELVAEVRGTRRGPFSFVPVVRPGQRWMPEALALDLGTFPASEGRTGVLQTFVEGLDEPLEISDVTSSHPYVTLKLRRDETFEGGEGRQKVFLDVVVEPGAPAATHRRKKAVRLSAKTNHPDATEIAFYIEMASTR